MKTIEVNFVCPDCKETELVQNTKAVEVREDVNQVLINESGTPGRKFNVLTLNRSVSDGKISSFACKACGFVLKSEERDVWDWDKYPGKGWKKVQKKQGGKPITNGKDLHSWLKKRKMINER